MSNAGTPLSAPELWQPKGKKKAPEKVAASVKCFQSWLQDSIVQRVKNSTFEKTQQHVEGLSELVLPQEWMETTCHPPFDKRGAEAFHKAVVSGANPTAFKDDADSRAILGTLHTLVALYWDVKSRNAYNEATFRRHMDSLVTDVFDHQYLIDGKPEFGEGFCVVLEESIWLTENAISTSEARPDALVVYGPINGTTIGEEIRFILQGTTAPDRTTAIPPPQLPLSPPISTSTDADPASTKPIRIPAIKRNPEQANLYANVQFQHNPRVDLVDLHLIATFLEYKNPSQSHRYEQLCMDFTTAHLQRRALALDNRTLFGFALGRDGVAVYASYWSGDYQRVYVSADPVHFFSFEDNAPLQIVRLFLCLRRLAKVMTAQFEVDKQAVVSRAPAIASNLHEGNTVWRSCKEEESSMPPPWSLPPAGGLPPGPSGPPHSSPSSRCDSDGPPPEKRQKTADTGNTSVLPIHVAGRQANANETEQTLTDALTAQNLSGFVEYERDIERWAVHVNLESTMGGDLDQEEPCMDGEASVPALKDAGATIEMSPEKVPPLCTAIPISPPPPYLSSCPHLQCV